MPLSWPYTDRVAPPGVHQHEHHPHPRADDGASGGRLAAAIVLNAGFGAVQIVTGLLFGSVAILADAGHQVVDACGLALALVAVRLAARPATSRRTFGWARADALGAMLSGVVLLASVVWVAIESLRRLVHPGDVSGVGVLVVGVVGIAVNGLGLLVVGRHDHRLSLRAARLHLLADLGGSVAVAMAGAAIVLTGWERVDPIASLAVVVLVAWSCWQLFVSASDVLLDRSPSHVDAEQIDAAVRTHDGVRDVHHLHVWSLGNGETAVSAHVVIDGEHTVHHAQEHIAVLESMLAERFDVHHVTLQVECHDCAAPAHR